MTLATQMATDLGTFIESDDFAVSAVYRKTGQPAKNIDVIFDNEYFEANYSVGVEGTEPFALARASDLPEVLQNDRLEIATVTYRIRGVEPDGTGLVRLKLERQ